MCHLMIASNKQFYSQHYYKHHKIFNMNMDTVKAARDMLDKYAQHNRGQWPLSDNALTHKLMS